MAEGIIKDVIAKAHNRRSFVQKIGMASAALAATGAAPKLANAQSGSAAFNDYDIFNFALNLEYLEAEFYSYAVWGHGIDQFGVSFAGQGGLSGTEGATTGGSKVSFSDPNVAALAMSLFNDEFDHVVLIQDTLAAVGATVVPKPAINLNAMGMGFASDAEFLTLSRIFEDIGVSAYGGAAPLLTAPSSVNAAARILATEGEHVGGIRTLIAQKGIIVTAIDAADIVPPPANYKYFSTNNVGITAVRTPGQVLALTYGGTSKMSGGFFPAGINGYFSTAGSASAYAMIDGSTISASPNPIASNDSAVTLTWNAATSGAQAIQIRIDSPDGPLFTENGPVGSAMTGNWVTDGMTFFLQDAALPMTLAHTLAACVVHISSSI